MAFQLSGDEQVFAWLVAESNLERRERLLAWLPQLAADPHGQATAPVRPNVFVALVPDLDVVVTYLVAEQFRTVRLLRLEDLR
ncbi:MAG: hypothetical protein M3450_07925 [Actinomycetota bacterium]|nr:hypothetical protein [Actinomycetota bacterium]